MTSPFRLVGGVLHCESVPLPEIARRFGTPCYVYSAAALDEAWREFRAALAGRDALVCYAVKANSNLAILARFARLGAGFDIVSGGELARVQASGGDCSRVVFSGVGKSEGELRQALETGILCFNVESAAELSRIERVAEAARRPAPIALRVNPDVDPLTHPYISTGLRTNKFGVPIEEAAELYLHASRSPHLRVIGIACHIGSQLLDPAPMLEASGKVLDFVLRLERDGIRLEHIDLGGGLGIRYREETPPPIAEFLAPVAALFAQRPERLLFEPGRRLVGNAGVLLTRVEYLKPGAKRSFAVVDAAMNDLVRPALYDAWHDIAAVAPRPGPAAVYDIVGPVCESGDFLGTARTLALAESDLLAVMSAGAYGMSMSSNYNTRPRPAEVLVEGGAVRLVRRRETLADLLGPEQAPDETGISEP
ncbi:MAG: diaminopimelate decarboxylase [Rhodocyclales bacterium CG_4_9_14_3_um_filter_68_10]|nr:MAG: diaminopimelate decarboxylase [Rhodocyclales bacterium CG_4_10_14_3_um_filter_68_10]PJA58340.1 MAG: diaminopimelate decarboxylase [Rhodocyclales bacterium CG_4_9_14_3_um_filter_68_10]